MEVEPFSVRLASPLETARGSIREREGFLVTVEYRGESGVGEATPLPGWTESRAECRDALDRAEAVADSLDWGIALARMEEPAARHGLALALADARARAGGEPLYRSLGGDTRAGVPVNATLGAEAGTPAAAGEAALEAVGSGFDCLKLKAGMQSVEEDVERVRAVRNAVGDGVGLRVDANGAWTPAEAETALDALGALEVAYVEQPLPARDLEGHAALRGGVDVALDESLAVHDLEDVLAVGAADVVVLKPMVVGGPDAARSVAVRAREAGVEPVVSTTIDAVVARTGAVHVAASLPEVRACGLATAGMLATDLCRDPAPVADGEIRVPQDNGLGLPGRPW